MKKWMISSFIVSLMCSIIIPVFAETELFSDVPENYWAYSTIVKMTEMGLLKGVGNGLFAPEKEITRAEFLTVIIRYLYPDDEVLQTDTWYSGYYKLAVEKQIITANDFSDLSEPIDLKKPILRQEMAYVLVNAYEKGLNQTIKEFVDTNEIADWNYIKTHYRDAIRKGYSIGLFVGIDDLGTFAPWNTMTRAEAAIVIYRLIDESARCQVDCCSDDSPKSEVATLETYETMIGNDEIISQNTKIWLADRIVIDENGFGSGNLNVSKFRRNALLSLPDGSQVIAYFNTEGIPVIALYNGNEIFKTSIGSSMKYSLLANGHCSINIGYNDNQIYYIFGCHAIEGYYGMLTVDDIKNQNKIEANKTPISLTYPQFYHIGKDFIFMFRDDTEHPCLWKYMVLNNQGSDWDFLGATAFIDLDYLYFNDIGYSRDGNIVALPYVIRHTEIVDNKVRNEGVFLIWSEDGMNHWSSLEEEGVSLPFAQNAVPKIVDIDFEWNMMNQESTFVTNEGVVFFTRITDDENGIPQIYLTQFDIHEKSIQSYQVTRNKKDFELTGSGTLTIPISRSQVVGTDKTIHLVYRLGDRVVISSADYTDGSVSDFSDLVLNDSVGAWEPNYDVELWETEHILCLFIQETYQGYGDHSGNSLISTPICLYYFFMNE